MSSRGDDSAFPCGDSSGMTMREWFAGQALAGFAHHPKFANTFIVGVLAVQHADVLLAELEKRDKGAPQEGPESP